MLLEGTHAAIFLIIIKTEQLSILQGR